MQISANLGFLFTELPLPDRVSTARDAGFDAVEMHDQAQEADLSALRRALGDMPVVVLGTFMGDSMGRAALSRAGFAQDFAAAADAAQALDAGAIHLVAGKGGDEATYLHNIDHALARTPCDLFIEPISPRAAPGYFLSSFAQAEAVLDRFKDPRLKIMADWFHIRALHDRAEGHALLSRLRPHIGHVQLARASDRGAPCPGLCDEIAPLMALLRQLDCPAIGLEYRPDAAPTRAIADTVAALRA
jgi:hydroxypyruvate isomerase